MDYPLVKFDAVAWGETEQIREEARDLKGSA
jgi:hypothetical protein